MFAKYIFVTRYETTRLRLPLRMQEIESGMLMKNMGVWQHMFIVFF